MRLDFRMPPLVKLRGVGMGNGRAEAEGVAWCKAGAGPPRLVRRGPHRPAACPCLPTSRPHPKVAGAGEGGAAAWHVADKRLDAKVRALAVGGEVRPAMKGGAAALFRAHKGLFRRVQLFVAAEVSLLWT